MVRAGSEKGAPVGTGKGENQCGTSDCGPLLRSLSVLLSQGSTWWQELTALAPSGAPQQVTQMCGPHSPKVTHKSHSDNLCPSDTDR